MPTGLHKINKNIKITTINKHHPKVLFIEGGYWVEPQKGFDVNGLFKKLNKVLKTIFGYCITEFFLSSYAEVGKRYFFTYQVCFKVNTNQHFTPYSKRWEPIILHKMPYFLEIIKDYGFSIHQGKNGA